MIPIATLEALLREGAISKEVYDRLMASSSVTRRRRGEIEADLLDLGADPQDVRVLYDTCEKLTEALRGKVRPTNGRVIHSVRVWILHKDALEPGQAQATAAEPAQVTAAEPAQVTAAEPAQVTAAEPAQVTAAEPAQVTAAEPAQKAKRKK
jgi:hypothetical protein